MYYTLLAACCVVYLCHVIHEPTQAKRPGCYHTYHSNPRHSRRNNRLLFSLLTRRDPRIDAGFIRNGLPLASRPNAHPPSPQNQSKMAIASRAYQASGAMGFRTPRTPRTPQTPRTPRTPRRRYTHRTAEHDQESPAFNLAEQQNHTCLWSISSYIV